MDGNRCIVCGAILNTDCSCPNSWRDDHGPHANLAQSTYGPGKCMTCGAQLDTAFQCPNAWRTDHQRQINFPAQNDRKSFTFSFEILEAVQELTRTLRETQEVLKVMVDKITNK